MRTLNFANRNIKELIRDPMSIIFCIGLPLFFLVIFHQFNIPVEEYSLNNFTPGIIIFSFSFIALFNANLVAKDRCTSLLARLFSSPMKPIEYVLGYTLALIPLTILQSILFFLVAILLGMSFSINIILTILVLIPLSLLFIGLGLLIGCISSDKSSGPLASLIVQLVSFTSGMWFSIDLAGKFFKFVCNILPFASTVKITKSILNNTSINLLQPIIIILIYTIIIYLLTIIIFKKKMISDNK